MTDVGGERYADLAPAHAGGLQLPRPVPDHPGDGPANLVPADLGQPLGEASGQLDPGRSGEHAEGRGHAGAGREDQGADAEGSGHPPRMDGAGSSGGDHGEPPKVAATFDGMHAGGAGHVLVDHPVDRRGGVFRWQADRFAEPSNGSPRRGEVQRHLSAQEELGVEIPEQEVGVRDGRFRPPEAVTGRPRVRSCALRPHLGQPERPDPGDAPSPRPDFDQVDDGNAHGEATALGEAVHAGRLDLSRDQGPAILDQARLGGGPAHVEGQDVGPPHCGSPEPGREDAGSRA